MAQQNKNTKENDKKKEACIVSVKPLSGRELDRDKNARYQPHDESINDKKLINGETPIPHHPPEEDPYQNPLDDEQDKKEETQKLSSDEIFDEEEDQDDRDFDTRPRATVNTIIKKEPTKH